MKIAAPRLDWWLFVECPSCGEDFDLAQMDEDYSFANAIFSNQWDNIKGEEIDCPKCKSTFTLDKVEY